MCGVLVLDVLDDWIHALLIVDVVTKPWGVNDVDVQTDIVLKQLVGGNGDLSGLGQQILQGGGFLSALRLD
ncbi:hypothetical protein WICPIJ_001638 [Wickerhamomyces pijperi]|uniref:Uncharacterized protein n=1 Tax=Wickerhamomyces pijperi TaxID=599730 RepID=A0A9P8TQD7_WICPI|nr:hypothetical protein WICPIJ_001638 [Wickerhamomyces pijperi]